MISSSQPGSAKRLVWLGCVLVCSLSAIAQNGAPDKLIINVPVADMYSAPRTDSDVVSQVIYGTSAMLLEENFAWARIRTPDQYTGWLNLAKVRRLPNNEPSYASAGRIVQVNSLQANLYREPDVTAHHPVLTVPFESRLEIVADGKGDDAGWLQVHLVDGALVWIQAGDVNPNPRSLSIDESLALARRFLGVTYTWGGGSSLGFDCSGFTQMLIRSRGIVMPRDADKQAAWEGVTAVDRKHLKPGDLLFFGGSATQITHTGMYMGHGQFIHDTVHEHPGVQVSKLKDPPWTRLLVACRRVAPAKHA
jgi:cell wall-associated NlpC family hydrolase